MYVTPFFYPLKAPFSFWMQVSRWVLFSPLFPTKMKHGSAHCAVRFWFRNVSFLFCAPNIDSRAFSDW